MGQATINESIWMDVMQAVVSMEDGYTTHKDAKEMVNKAIRIAFGAYAMNSIDLWNERTTNLGKLQSLGSVRVCLTSSS